MEYFLLYFAAILLVIVAAVLLNSKFFKMPPEIAILCLALILGVIFKALLSFNILQPVGTVFENLSTFRIDDLLMDALLCFMLFSGASDLKFHTLKKHFRPICLFALLTTVVTALFYGALFFVILSCFGVHAHFYLCILLGAIISPTDPIAATGILNKLGLSPELTAIMEGESLFNDGTGVALFIFIKGIITKSNDQGFLVVMGKELLGAIAVGLAISFLCCLLLKMCKNQTQHILVSLLAITSCYSICELIGCSGVIASVVCGIYFATFIDNQRTKGIFTNEEPLYDHFWSTIDKLFNYILYVFIGLSFIFIVKVQYVLLAIVVSIVLNFVTRYIGVFASTVLMGKIPNNYNKGQFTLLMTWSGMKGGLSLALMLSVADIIPAEIYDVYLFMVFGTICFTTIVQGLTVEKVYLGLNKKVEAKLANKQ